MGVQALAADSPPPATLPPHPAPPPLPACLPACLSRACPALQSVLGGPIIYNEYTIDNSLSVEQSRQAIIAMIVAAAATTAFILLRFGPGFSASGFLSMASAGIFAVMCFAMGQYEVNLPIVSAILTVFSYAINDCVVVFDRIRFEMDRPPAPTTPLLLRNTVNRAMVSEGRRPSSLHSRLTGRTCASTGWLRLLRGLRACRSSAHH